MKMNDSELFFFFRFFGVVVFKFIVPLSRSTQHYTTQSSPRMVAAPMCLTRRM